MLFFTTSSGYSVWVKKISQQEIRVFQKHVWDFYTKNRRDFPWRRRVSPYRVFVSEVMLQQTQADRVAPKFHEFVKKFPNVTALAHAPQREVLMVWQGLGYNRRARSLARAAEIIVRECNGRFPREVDALEALPGIGPYTARAIRVFAYNKPEVFIETNIRTVFIHHFFARARKSVSDAALMPLIAEALSLEEPREWYSALMDYGAHLKHTMLNPSRKSTTHKRQSRFEGSLRQVRGKVLRALLVKAQTKGELQKNVDDAIMGVALEDLIREGFIERSGGVYSIR